VRIVALDTVHRRHVSVQVNIDQILVRIVTHEAEVRHRCRELERLITAVGIVAGRAILGSGRMGSAPFHEILNLSMARIAQLGTGCPEQSFLVSQVRLMTLDAAPIPDRGVHRSFTELCFEVGVAGKTQGGPLDGQTKLRTAGTAVAAFTRSIFKWRMDLRTQEHRGRVRPVRFVAAAATRPADRQLVSGVDVVRFVADEADFAFSYRQQVVLGRGVRLMAIEAGVHHRGVRRLKVAGHRRSLVIVTDQAEFGF